MPALEETLSSTSPRTILLPNSDLWHKKIGRSKPDKQPFDTNLSKIAETTETVTVGRSATNFIIHLADELFHLSENTTPRDELIVDLTIEFHDLCQQSHEDEDAVETRAYFRAQRYKRELAGKKFIKKSVDSTFFQNESS
jgi:hypothetical protein